MPAICESDKQLRSFLCNDEYQVSCLEFKQILVENNNKIHL
jgi:hypothetical protein